MDDLLDSSTPKLAEPQPGLNDALIDLVASTKRSAAVRRRKPRRAVLVGATAAVMMLGGTAAAAVTMGGWTAPWAEDPLGSITFTLPSGGVCEQRIGDLHMDNAAAQTMVQEWLSDHTLNEIADVDAALQATRAEGDNTYSYGDKEIAVGYGTPYFDADYEYVNAVDRAQYEAIQTRLKADGFTEYFDYSWAGELHCSGSNPYPRVPRWKTKIK